MLYSYILFQNVCTKCRYSYSAAAALNGSCQVQLAPSSKAGAAMDSAYGRQCLDYFLSTISLRPTQYDVILFNFGLHDIDYLDKYPEVCILFAYCKSLLVS